MFLNANFVAVLKFLKKSFRWYILLLLPVTASAQENWPSPEVEQMYHHATEDIARADYKDAIITCRQAIKLAPANTILYETLGAALYLSGDFAEAGHVLTQATTMPAADEECFRLLAASREQQSDTKQAKAALQSGLTRFPSSGPLYCETGIEYQSENNPDEALKAWAAGIAKDPAYAPDYYNAAMQCLSSGQVLWGLLYGETYLLIQQDTAHADELKVKLFAGYKTLFDNIGAADGAKRSKKETHATGFEEAVIKVYTNLTPVISDGITTENLTMVRTRFLMDWFATYAAKYPFSLFTYQDNLIRTGHFDMENQWLFGKAESEAGYNAWNSFHEGDISRFLRWQSANLLHPVAKDVYNLPKQ